MDGALRAVVTGASSGIGAATVRRLRAEGWSVLAVARREERLRALAAETGCEPCPADLTDPDDVARVAQAAGACSALVNNAGGAVGTDPVATGDPADWQRMFDVNVLATLRVTQALLPALRASGRGDVLVMSSTAAHVVYEGGGGYAAAKHAEGALARTLRLELAGDPVRVIEIAPGMVRTEEFSLNRFGGDREKADAVYAGVREPLTAEDVADCVAWTLTRPHHVNVDLLVVRPLAQAAQHKVVREP
ncbi:SDR family oxidoreductase [Quadrisphaera sp. DSM 44207]|uniref:SDR family oxidoreductase n=1 Tax=Quadrisphaera sp. DSM 44207 TaxID=1881057 RepID=UPI00088A7BFC|nr:SDR family oxidoreductase [Quadrisphaera sp. DSM 44207]SDQ05584.1 NADP-dependent 3-hydroxy acid dehydrogenase YdfG [Quadrisphaera sp. DSM 44207]